MDKNEINKLAMGFVTAFAEAKTPPVVATTALAKALKAVLITQYVKNELEEEVVMAMADALKTDLKSAIHKIKEKKKK